MTITQYAMGTYLRTAGMWDVFVAGAALCPDGNVRRLKRIAPTATDFTGVSAAVVVRGRTVSGYVSVTDLSDPNGNGTANDPTCTITFHPLGKNRAMLPDVPMCKRAGTHRYTVRLSIPIRMAGTVIDHSDMTECPSCGHRVPTSSLTEGK